MVCTSTASGKSLCYALPIIEALAENPNTCTILMFPTKALAQDQLRALRSLCTAAFGSMAPHIEVYDGDTAKVLAHILHTTCCSHTMLKAVMAGTLKQAAGCASHHEQAECFSIYFRYLLIC